MRKNIYIIISIAVLVLLTVIGCSKEISPEERKAQFSKAITELSKIDKQILQQQQKYTETVQLIVSGSVSTVDGYQIIQRVNQDLLTIFSKAELIEIPDNAATLKEIKESYQVSSGYLRDTTKKTMNYLDSNKTSDLAEAKDALGKGVSMRQSAAISLAKEAAQQNINLSENK